MKNIIDEKPSADLNGRLLFTTKFVDRYDLENKDILNIGCGFGWFEISVLNKDAKSVTGTEISEEDLKVAKENIFDKRASFLVGSAIKLPFADSSFDTVTSWEVIEHIPKDTELKMFEEVNRVLKKDGVFYLSTPYNSFFSNLFDPAWWLINHRHYSIETMYEFAEISKYEILKIEVKGGFWTIANSLNMYFAKWIFRRGIFFKSFFEVKENKEYQQMVGSVNMFVKFKKIRSI